jgi:hypothetical protein
MPLYMDHHDLPGVKAEDVAKAHEADVRVQGQYGRRVSAVLGRREGRSGLVPRPGSGQGDGDARSSRGART